MQASIVAWAHRLARGVPPGEVVGGGARGERVPQGRTDRAAYLLLGVDGRGGTTPGKSFVCGELCGCGSWAAVVPETSTRAPWRDAWDRAGG
ncbi:hypothetical protein ABZ079_12890 [Streptomyces sp. NPDC006314]|uniref:hypothetical protein n=1 Tax=Streptomyces sp. NPDC006314 TaxID=3154475 RepID=UPI0033B1CF09